MYLIDELFNIAHNHTINCDTLTNLAFPALPRVAAPWLRQGLVLDRLEGVVQRFLGDPSVSLKEVEKNVSLVLVNSHYSFGSPRPLLPNVVEVGAMHCRPPTPIQDDLELRSFLDDSPTPVVLFSLGSAVHSEQLPLRLRQALIGAFRRLPYRVVWKWEGAPLADLPSNVLTRPWLPQQDVLGHPKVRGFFSHGGLSSLQEALYHGVAVLGMPLMSDQHLNVRQAAAQGLAIELTLEELTEDAVVSGLTRLLEEPQFLRRVEERSALLRDQETTPLARALYWTEHVMRRGGGAHLRSRAAHLPWYQHLLLDVAAVLAAAALLLAVLAVVLLRLAARLAVRAAKKAAAKAVDVLRKQLNAVLRSEVSSELRSQLRINLGTHLGTELRSELRNRRVARPKSG